MEPKSLLRSFALNLLIWSGVAAACSNALPELPHVTPEQRVAAETGLLRAACTEAELSGVKLEPEAAAVCRAVLQDELDDGGADGGAAK